MKDNNLEEIKKDIERIVVRNKSVETDKIWETSYTRKVLIMLLTYITVLLLFCLVQLSNPFTNALVPTLGFLLSIFSIPFFKKKWVKYIYKSKDAK